MSPRPAGGPVSPRVQQARVLFAGIARDYERIGALLSLGQDARWRRFLVSTASVPPAARILDVAAGTGLVSRQLLRRTGAQVVALDQSEPMVREGTRRSAGSTGRRIGWVLGRAEALPFPEASFDAVTFTYLLRYVDDPEGVLAELARVLRPGGSLSGLEFGVPDGPAWRAGWLLQTRLVLPAVGRLASPGWARAGRFLGPSIEDFARLAPLPEQVRWWQAAGIRRVRTRRLTFGAAVVTWGVKGG